MKKLLHEAYTSLYILDIEYNLNYIHKTQRKYCTINVPFT